MLRAARNRAHTGLVVFALTLCGTAGVAVARSPRRDGLLNGEVLACSGAGAKSCSRTEAVVTVLEARHGRLGHVVAKLEASGGRFRFSLVPGSYLSRASAVHARLNGGGCASPEVSVTAGKTTKDVIRCYAKATRR